MRINALHMVSFFSSPSLITATVRKMSSFSSNSQPIYVVSSVSRGLGQEFARQLLIHSSASVIGCVRSLAINQSLEDLRTTYPGRLHLVQADLEDQTSVEKAGEAIRSLTDRVDVLLNVAGILGDAINSPGPERSLAKLDRDWFHKSLEVNLIGHVMMTQQVLPLMTVPKDSISSRSPSKVVNVSARVGSIADNNLGGWYSYRMSKAALNMFTKTLSIEMKRQGGLALSIHPGTVSTDLSAPFSANVRKEKLFTPEKSVKLMLDVIEKATMQDSGSFFAYDGTIIPWGFRDLVETYLYWFAPERPEGECYYSKTKLFF
eukprot:gene1716-3321_t